jgi:uncharacterized protein YjbJ (UPF0337 family)
MNSDILKGKWKSLKGSVKAQWGRLTDDDVTLIDGELDKLVGTVQTRYGYERDRAEGEVKRFLDQYDDSRADVIRP